MALASVDTIQPWARSFFQQQLSRQPGTNSLSFDEAAALARCTFATSTDLLDRHPQETGSFYRSLSSLQRAGIVYPQFSAALHVHVYYVLAHSN